MRIERRMDVPRETLDPMILRALALKPQYGWALSQHIHQISGKKLLIQQGSLYPSLRRLESRGWIKGKWVTTGRRQRVKLYEATKDGMRQLRVQNDSWRKLAAAVAEILEVPQGGSTHPRSPGWIHRSPAM